jgi:sugar lactone lactonase YvrE
MFRKENKNMLGKQWKNIYLVTFVVVLVSVFAANTHAQYNGECWAADYTNIYKISPNGEAISITGFSQPLSVSINPKDGSCWVADTDAIRVRKFSASGQELITLDGAANSNLFAPKPNLLTNPSYVGVDPRDGSCWVATINMICKFSADGKQIFIKSGFNEPIITVNPTNGDCWVADSSNARILKLTESGNQAWVKQINGMTQPKSISVNPMDNSAWILDAFTHKLVKLSSDGSIVKETASADATGAIMSTAVTASSDGGCWVAIMVDMMNDQVIKVSADGQQTVKAGGFAMPSGLAFDPKDNGCWVADSNGGRIVKLSAAGQEIINIGGFSQPKTVTVAYLVK